MRSQERDPWLRFALGFGALALFSELVYYAFALDSTRETPSSPSHARPQSTGRPTKTARAPSPSAIRARVPEVTPDEGAAYALYLGFQLDEAELDQRLQPLWR